MVFVIVIQRISRHVCVRCISNRISEELPNNNSDKKKFINEINKVLKVDKNIVTKYLLKAKKKYDLTKNIFLEGGKSTFDLSWNGERARWHISLLGFVNTALAIESEKHYHR